MTTNSELVINDRLRQRLHLVAHLLEYGDEVIVLRGPEGAGRSALLDHIAGTVSGTRIIRLSGRTIESGVQLSAKIADGLGLTAQSDQYTPREFERSLGAKIKAHTEPTVVIADDCETWSLDLVATLRRLRAKSQGRLRAVVTIDIDCEFVAHLESSLAEDERFHMVDIPPFEHEDVAAYVALQARANQVPVPDLTDRIIDEILAASDGRPGAMNSVIAGLLQGQTTNGTRQQRLRGASLVALVVIVIGVALIVLLRDKRSDETGTDAELSMPEAGSMANQDPLVQRPRSVIQPLDSSSRDSSSSTEPPPAPKKLPEQRGAAPGAPDVYDPFRIDTLSNFVPNRPAGDPVTEVIPKEATAGEHIREEVYAPPEAAEAPQISDVDESPPIAAAMPELAEPEPAEPEPVIETPVVSVSEPEPPATYTYSLQWLREQDPSAYVVQMFGTGSASAATSFLGRLDALDSVTIAELKHRGNPWFVVLYGLFPNRGAAENAIARLPDSLKATKPWPRPVANLR